MDRALMIQAVIYANPDHYPPVVNGAWVMDKAGVHLDILGRDYVGLLGSDYQVTYPSQTRIRRAKASMGPSWLRFGIFLIEVLRRADRHADLFLGYDMHGFLAARLLATLYRRPLVYHCHELVDESSELAFGGRAVLQFQRLFARTADLIIVPDQDRALIMRKSLDLPKLPVVAVNSPLRRSESTGKRLREALKARDHRLRRLVFRQGSIGPGQGIETTIQSMPSWSSSAWGFVVMGRGDPEYLAHLRNLAERLGVAERFVVLPPVSYDDVFQFTGGADVGHSLYAPIDSNHRFSTTASNKLFEYMAASLPVLVSDRTGQRAFVEKYKCGLAADESSPDSIAEAVNMLLGNPDLARSLGEAGARAFEEQFNYERQFEPVLAAFGAICRASKGGQT